MGHDSCNSNRYIGIVYHMMQVYFQHNRSRKVGIYCGRQSLHLQKTEGKSNQFISSLTIVRVIYLLRFF